MKTSTRSSTATLAIILAATLSVHGDIVSQWTFEGDTNTPAMGLGTATLIGGTAASYATGNGGGRG